LPHTLTMQGLKTAFNNTYNSSCIWHVMAEE
jgi:hypothetical protein